MSKPSANRLLGEIISIDSTEPLLDFGDDGVYLKSGNLISDSNYTDPFMEEFENPFLVVPYTEEITTDTNINDLGTAIKPIAGGKFARSTDLGVTWVETAAVDSVINVRPSFAENGVWVATGKTVSNIRGILRSVDDGLTWVFTPNISAASSAEWSHWQYLGNGVFIAYSPQGIAIRSTDYGVTWLNHTSAYGSRYSSFKANIRTLGSSPNGQAVIAVYESGVMYTRDYGLTWTMLSYSNCLYASVTTDNNGSWLVTAYNYVASGTSTNTGYWTTDGFLTTKSSVGVPFGVGNSDSGFDSITKNIFYFYYNSIYKMDFDSTPFKTGKLLTNSTNMLQGSFNSTIYHKDFIYFPSGKMVRKPKTVGIPTVTTDSLGTKYVRIK